ncbi:hypothetical protein [Flavobacterium piscis]|uniref:Glycine-rich domain-containing protein n=1 Tax=Flavobacterium piscis TaxID=1114874 RepID=A0ABU1YEK0_9FLAO|nr:hypothetical protein [Flavobacterium piscis]MDR7212672.1 hypothetical protein [Flavobacterium piscis]
MRLKLSLLSFFIFYSAWAQTTLTFTSTTPNTFKIPAGVTSLGVECWGSGGSGGGASAVVSVFGGGGAYGKVTLGVTPAAVLNYKVGAGGIGVNGTDGGNGEATNFSTVVANGGSGGKNGNSSNGAGGFGGLASGAGTIFSGGSGATPGLVLGVLSSGGGGGSAGTASNGNNANIGTGGAAVTGGGAGSDGILLAGNGTDNVSLGGGGGGAKGLLFSDFRGGNGGNGQIKITYSCPVYALTGTSAAGVSTATGTTSLVTLTGGASLPVGDYVVTYNRSNPSGTGLTATMSVGGAGGTGTFSAVGLSVTGSSIITITNLTSGSCSNNITTGNAATITVSSTSVGGTINTPATICSGGTSGLLTLSGYTGTILGWESSVSPFSSWTPISNTTATYTSGPLTQTTRFRAIVNNGVCDAVNSAFATVTVNPLPAITTSGTLNDICFSGSAQSANLLYTATTNTPISYSIIWNAAANTAGLVNQGVTLFTFLPEGGSLNTIVIPAGVVANTYLGTMTILNADCLVTQAIQLTIKPTPDAPIPGIVTEPTCATPTGSVTLSELPILVTWLIKQSGTASTTYTDTGTTYIVSNLAPGNYTFTVEYTGSCISSPSANVIIDELVTNIYTGIWSNGIPTINQNLVFDANYTSAGGGTGSLNGCSCTVNPGVNILINSNDTLTITNTVTNNGGVLTFENNASLLQTTNAINLGNIIYKRISVPMENFDYTYWSSPVMAQTLFNLSPNTLSDKYFSYTGTSWKQEVAATTTMIPGKGYIIRTPKAGLWGNGENVIFPYAQPVQFVGIPNNGNILGEAVVTGKFYLIGNPYPSALDADKFLFPNPNPNNSDILDGTIYFWTHNTAIQPSGFKYVYSSNDYASYNGVGGIGTLPAYLGGVLPSGKIAAGQSFFALAKASGNIQFNNTMRIEGNNNQFFKPGKTAKPNLLERHRLWLNMTNAQGAFKQILIGYIQGATNGLDNNFDGVSLDANAFIDFYSTNSGSNLVIQGRALPFSDTDEVPLGYRTIIAGDFTISIDHADGLLTNHAVFLHDMMTNTLHDLRVSGYTFNTVPGTFKNRFVLKYANKTLAVNDYENSVLAWCENQNIRINSTKGNIDKIFIYDLSGKQLYNKQKVADKQFVTENLSFAEQIVLVRVFLENDKFLTKKVILTKLL